MTENMFFKIFVKYSYNEYFSPIGSIVFYIKHTYKGKVSSAILKIADCSIFIV